MSLTIEIQGQFQTGFLLLAAIVAETDKALHHLQFPNLKKLDLQFGRGGLVVAPPALQHLAAGLTNLEEIVSPLAANLTFTPIHPASPPLSAGSLLKAIGCSQRCTQGQKPCIGMRHHSRDINQDPCLCCIAGLLVEVTKSGICRLDLGSVHLGYRHHLPDVDYVSCRQ